MSDIFKKIDRIKIYTELKWTRLSYKTVEYIKYFTNYCQLKN